MNNKQLETYLKRMDAAMEEKLFFLDKINWDEVGTIIDFGCADGTMIEALWRMTGEEIDLSNKHYIGIEKNSALRALARKRFDNKDGHFNFCEKLNNDHFRKLWGTEPAIIIFSSVWHEIFSYCSKEEINEIISLIKEARYIIIRDMIGPSEYDGKIYYKMSNEDKSIPLPAENILKQIKELHSYEDEEDNKYEALLKYLWQNNLEYELPEKYFSIDWEHLTQELHTHKVYFLRDYTNEYLQRRMSEKGLLINFPTHRTIIYRKKGDIV